MPASNEYTWPRDIYHVSLDRLMWKHAKLEHLASLQFRERSYGFNWTLTTALRKLETVYIKRFIIGYYRDTFSRIRETFKRRKFRYLVNNDQMIFIIEEMFIENCYFVIFRDKYFLNKIRQRNFSSDLFYDRLNFKKKIFLHKMKGSKYNLSLAHQEPCTEASHSRLIFHLLFARIDTYNPYS